MQLLYKTILNHQTCELERKLKDPLLTFLCNRGMMFASQCRVNSTQWQDTKNDDKN